MKNTDALQLLNRRWTRLRYFAARLSSGDTPTDTEFVPAETAARGAMPHDLVQRLRAMLTEGAQFPTREAERVIRGHYFKVWRTGLRLGKPSGRFDFPYYEKESYSQCLQKFPRELVLVADLNELLYPKMQISLGPVAGADGRAVMHPIPDPPPVLPKPKLLWVPCVPNLTKAENLQAMAAPTRC